MKNLILISLMLITLTSKAQYKKDRSKNNTGIQISVIGAIFSSISILVPDGGEWTYKDRYNSKVITKPFYQCPNRVTMFSIGLTLSIGGIIYKLNNK